jgi:hypothetical protein
VSAQLIDLADVESRAGASDTNRTAWLLERQQGITATNIRDLYMRKTTIAKLVDEKLGRTTDSFTGNRYTAWGNKREPIIAADVCSSFPGLRPETRVFHAADNSRYLASPDLLGEFEGQLAVGEIKTGKDDIRGGFADYYGKGYHLQQQWCMRVIGARVSVYASEQHDSDWQNVGGEYEEPQPRELFADTYVERYDEALVAELVKLADEFLAALDRAAAGGAPDVDEALDTHAVNYLRGLDAEKQGKALKEASFLAVKKALADQATFSQASPLARISWKRGGEETTTEQRVDREVVDEKAAKKAHPEEWRYLQRITKLRDKYAELFAGADEAWRAVLDEHTTTETVTETITATSRENLRITAVKQKEMGK